MVAHSKVQSKFARLQMKPSLTLYYVYTGFIYRDDTKVENTSWDIGKHSQNGSSSVLS